MTGRLAIGAAVGCGIAGLAIGLALGDTKTARLSARPGKPALRIASSFHWHDRDRRLRVVSGSLGVDPRRGFVLFQIADRSFDQLTSMLAKGRLVSAPPTLFTMPGRSGALRIVASSRWDWVLETSGGSRAVLSRAIEGDASFYVLGKRLDPAHLPRVARQGVAVPVRYGPSNQKAVLLVGYARRYEAWRRYGYLPGFSLPAKTNPLTTLERPLLGPDGDLYRIDSRHERLERIGRYVAPRRAAQAIPHPGCSTWPQRSGDRYRACPGSIVLMRRDGTRTTLIRRKGNSWEGWGFVAPSADGRTLLLEYDIFACGLYPQAAFLRTGSRLEFPVPDPADSGVKSEPLGWLRDGSALIAVQNQNGCEGAPRSGIYRAWPGGKRPLELVLETSGTDATIWGSGT